MRLNILFFKNGLGQLWPMTIYKPYQASIHVKQALITPITRVHRIKSTNYVKC